MSGSDINTTDIDFLLQTLRDNRVIVWGATVTGKCILNAIGDLVPDISVWDRQRTGWLCGRSIAQPEMIEPVDCRMKNTCFILAFNAEKSYRECSEKLSSIGYCNIIYGSDFLRRLRTHKIESDCVQYKLTNKDVDFMLQEHSKFIVLDDLYADAGTNFNDHYLVQDLWAAKKIFAQKPSIHYDIGSRVDGFITHILSFGMKTVLIDIRGLDTCGIEDLSFINEDATLLRGLDSNSVESMSALCSLEHFGLGRYGDPLDPDAHKNAFMNIQRVMKSNGNLYISVPISSTSRLEFNAHRIYAPQYILRQFNQMKLVEFSYVADMGIRKNARLDTVGGDIYTGLFHFRKR